MTDKSKISPTKTVGKSKRSGERKVERENILDWKGLGFVFTSLFGCSISSRPCEERRERETDPTDRRVPVQIPL